MASQLKHTVMPSGGDFTSLDAAIDHIVASHADLVSADVYADVEIDGTWSSADTTAVTINGITTDATRYLSVYTTAAARHDGKWDTGAYIYSDSGGSGLYIRINHCRAFGLQITGSGSGIKWNNGGAGVFYLGYNILKANGGALGIDSEYLYQGSTVYAYNNIVYDWSNTGILNYSGGTGNTFNLYNNTVRDCSGRGIRVAAADHTINSYNNLCYNNGTDFVNSAGSLVNNNCLSKDATADDFGGANNRASKTIGFVDAAADDFHLASTDTDAIDYGATNPSSGLYSDDIDGNARGATWDIGADEYVAAGGAEVTLTMTSCVQNNKTTGLLVPIEAYMSTASGVQKNISDTFELPAEIITTPASGVQKNVVDTPSLFAEIICAAIDGIQKNITDTPSIAVEIVLNVLDGVQKNVADVITLVIEAEGGVEVTLTVYSGVQRNFVDTLTIPLEATMDAASGIQRNVAETPEDILESILEIINGVQKNVGDVISDLPAQINVIVSDGVQKNVGDISDLSAEFSLLLADGIQKNIGDAGTIDIEALLSVVDGIQKNIAGKITLSGWDTLARILRVIAKSPERTFTIKTQRTIQHKGTRSIELIVD